MRSLRTLPTKIPSYKGRYITLIFILSLIALALVARLVDLTVINRTFLQGQGNARTLRTLTVPAYRGMILDRNGEPLAISTPVTAVWANPKEFAANKSQLAQLSDLLNIPRSQIHSRIEKASDKEFVYLKRGLDPQVGNAVKNLQIPGIYLQGEFRRYYPEGEVTAHILGFTNVDDKGQEGLELEFDQWLRGIPGIKRVLKDRLGHIVADVDVIRAPRPGNNLVLSIDHRIQYFAYRELAAGVQKYKAVSGSVVVLDPRTGEILAMANWPTYNPNNRPATHDDRYRNRAVTDLFEPGSTIKSFSMATALASGKYNVNSKIDTSPGVIYVAGHKVDDDGHNNGVIDLTTILQVSSNVGMSKVITSLPPQLLWNTLHNVGFGEITDSGFPGERSGLLPNYAVWNPFVLSTMSFGYGLSVTTLQLAQAYAVLAADGVKYPVTFIKRTAPVTGKQVIDKKIAEEMRSMLESVLAKGGTAPLARVPGYRITGKTGTARIAIPGGYERDHHNAIFVGIAPASNPRLVIAVMLHDPQGGQYYGGYTAGPIFAHIMGESLRMLNVPPDDPASLMSTTPQTATPPPGLAD